MKNALIYISLFIVLVCGIAAVSSIYNTGNETYHGEETNVLEYAEEAGLIDDASVGTAERPAEAEGVAEVIVASDLEKTMAANNVAAVDFDYRGFDTLGESFILLTAIAGSFVILARPRKEGHE